MQVSDRRLTRAGRAASEPLRIVDDHANKAVFLDNRFIFSYTGLAWFRGKPSEEWLAKHWAGDDADPYDAGKRFGRFAASLTSQFHHVGWTDSIKRLAYIGVGWTGNGSAVMQPAMIVITNYHGTSSWLATAEENFKIIHKTKPTKISHYLHAAGVGIPNEHWRDINREIRRMVDHKVSPALVSISLLRFIDLVSKNNETVGRRYMVTCIPRSLAAVSPKDFSIYLNGPPSLSNRTFFYVDGPHAHWPQFGPIFSTAGVYSSGFKSTGPGSGIAFGDPFSVDT
ncbi:hypothetical protein [Sphingomonas aerolata]|uniref:hypothetical protein n=1 Tax=Sphingomonas aerolata TaxID=185951 RepID=UPI002FDF4F2C